MAIQNGHATVKVAQRREDINKQSSWHLFNPDSQPLNPFTHIQLNLAKQALIQYNHKNLFSQVFMDICFPVCMSQEKPRTTEWLILQFLIYHKILLIFKKKQKNVWLCSYKSHSKTLKQITMRILEGTQHLIRYYLINL